MHGVVVSSVCAAARGLLSPPHNINVADISPHGFLLKWYLVAVVVVFLLAPRQATAGTLYCVALCPFSCSMHHRRYIACHGDASVVAACGVFATVAVRMEPMFDNGNTVKEYRIRFVADRKTGGACRTAAPPQ